MASIRNLRSLLVAACLLGMPAFASAEQAPSELCGGDNSDGKDTTASKTDPKKPAEKADDKSKGTTEDRAKEGERQKS